MAAAARARKCGEPLRERPDVVAGRVRINRVVAALLAPVAGGTLLFLS